MLCRTAVFITLSSSNVKLCIFALRKKQSFSNIWELASCLQLGFGVAVSWPGTQSLGYGIFLLNINYF